ncbi:unnamed protein product [Ceutorhynchus assimilis]|uniref:CRAL-TRIO domain-containing protein n=1 Tax=Ceutorhynchus assimilis TaxID=467358 RepID=A0A9P0DDR5_9CUCU|nr:unnamed protein product [Ceutorhynchus assimilis]
MVCKKSVRSLVEEPSGNKRELILKEINEIDEDKLKHNERLIQEWIDCQKHFPKNIDPGLIRGTLRGHKHILERTKQKLEQHLAARHLYPEIFGNRSPFEKEIVQAMDVVNIAIVPRLSPTGRIIVLLNLNRYDPSEFNYQNVVKLFFMLYELLISSDTLYSGEIAIFDASNLTPGHIAKWFGPFFKTVMIILKEAYAVRLKELYIINAPHIMSKMVSAIKPLLHSKVRNSIYILDNSQPVLDKLGPDYLPSDFGGNLKSIRQLSLDYYDVLNDNAKRFEDQEDVKIIGIPEKVYTKLYMQDQIGIEGSFRKLEID